MTPRRPQGTSPGSFGIIILAGGRGSRLGGRDKPGLVVGDRTLLGAVAAAGTAAGARKLIVVGPERPGLPGVRFVQEEPPGAGPVPALRRGLAEAGDAPWVALLAADLPFLRADHIRALLRAARGSRPDGSAEEAGGHGGAVLADDAGRPQGLISCWRTVTLGEAAAGYAGDSLRGLLGPLSPVMVRLTPGPGDPPPWLDCDTPDDLRKARERAAGNIQVN
jgi:molybdopterin-guanine dinucleotide biosynthesis protein A